jgi:L-threonylcarbamoyladenylate synthase
MPVLAADQSAIDHAAALLRAGQVVAFPTETVYGLGGDATSDSAVAAIYAAKRRPRFNPLIAHVPDLAAALLVADFNPRALRLATLFWPGPLTLVLPRRRDSPLSLLISAGLDSVAVRVPAHPVALRLLVAVGRPLAAPSANPSGRVSPTTADHVAAYAAEGFDPALILDGGACTIGVESTVVDLTGPRPVLLRPGGVSREQLIAALGPIDDIAHPTDRLSATGSKSPGLQASHYAPRLPVRLDAAMASSGEALLGFGVAPTATMNLSPAGDLSEAASHLFAMLRALDRPELFSGIAVMPIPSHGLGAAINDRLQRAAAPRIPDGRT